MRPHEEAKLLSPEDLAEEKFPLTLEEWRRVLAHIAALEADNAAKDVALEDAQSFMTVLCASMHESENVREREVLESINAALRPIPGTTILSEHAKALVRARNEGLERARKYVHENLHLVPEAAAIDAMKEAET